ncbi:Zinc finger protein DPF3 [Acipenser ruthenus]|uniref:Zinc finger protein DPF3 n=1 Tax=Acipenser ruthenus TaxID=7906 RepID=A0A662YR46_ACIRT|nr:Zinc finger protein DPF3 [Acipenser ruthenus]
MEKRHRGPEGELPQRKEGQPAEGTTLEALLRGEGLDKKNNSKDEESLLEIQGAQCELH